MKGKRLSGLDYLLIGLSVVLFASAVGMLAIGWYPAAVGLFCVFGCILLLLVQRQLSKPEPKVYEQPAYQEMVQKMASSKRVTEMQLNLMKTKLQEKEHELQKYIRMYGPEEEEEGEQHAVPVKKEVLHCMAGKEGQCEEE